MHRIRLDGCSCAGRNLLFVADISLDRGQRRLIASCRSEHPHPVLILAPAFFPQLDVLVLHPRLTAYPHPTRSASSPALRRSPRPATSSFPRCPASRIRRLFLHPPPPRPPPASAIPCILPHPRGAAARGASYHPASHPPSCVPSLPTAPAASKRWCSPRRKTVGGMPLSNDPHLLSQRGLSASYGTICHIRRRADF